MTFSEALEQYLDARDKLSKLRFSVGDTASAIRAQALAAMTEAATRMDELMPCGERHV